MYFINVSGKIIIINGFGKIKGYILVEPFQDRCLQNRLLTS